LKENFTGLALFYRRAIARFHTDVEPADGSQFLGMITYASLTALA